MKTFCALSASLLALVLAGCGGSSSSESSSSTTVSTTSGKNVRLSQADWSAFTATRANARDVNNAAITKFAACRRLIVSAAPPDKVNACLGNSTSSVVTTGKQTLNELDKVTSDASGACAKASQDLHGNVKLYVASVQAIQTSVAQNKTPSTQSIDTALSALTRARASNVAFVAACKPAGAA